ncbi:acyl-CoA reductase [Gracilimonas tropica]|uniref:acyl-CoA reductase n=1 Tax=Gracilimonas tropica TaxID=454600 RepID=UPI00037BB8F0|nr:acyl-CoA reductase [Gracilimonas tropica]
MQRITKISQTLKNWLNPKNPVLQKAIQQTVEEGLFSMEDVEFQLNVLRENVENGEIQEWIKRAGLNDRQNAKGEKVLCLHAGNLPLVGFQTALGVILSGAGYYGKLSRKDPYLLGSFLKEMQNLKLDQQIKFSTDLNAFQQLNADAVVFAGSETSVPQVKNKISKLKAALKEANYIIRTAKFSIAYLDEWNEQVKCELTEAMLRYGGKGCRSVALVVAKFELDEVKEELLSEMQEFWEKNPQHQKPQPELKYQYAYNKGIQRNQLWLEDFLIQETDEFPETNFTVNWVRGDEEKVRSLRMNFGNVVQSVYTTGAEINGLKTEPLSKAQKPPLWWKPDGVDVVRILLKSIDN